METEIYITNSAKKRYPLQIDEVISSCSKKVKEIFPLNEVDVVVVIGKSEIGIHGNSFYEDTILIIIDSNYDGKDFVEKLSSTYFHELHHLARIATVGYGETLEEAIVTEGLALAMEREMGYTTSYHQFENPSELSLVLQEFEKERHKKYYDHNQWFFGEGRLPKWSGYKLGYYFVSKYFETSDKKSSNSFSTPAEAILNTKK